MLAVAHSELHSFTLNAGGLMNTPVYELTLTLDMSDGDLVKIMQSMRQIRASSEPSVIMCFIHGFDDDPRDLWHIPEVKRFCRRLTDIGFISDLDFAPHWDPDLNGAPGGGGLGAVEIWLLSEGRFGQILDLTPELLAEATSVVARANARANEVLGMTGGTG
jgi:hypothetical protein